MADDVDGYAESLSERLFLGLEKLRVVGPPYSGKSALIHRVQQHLEAASEIPPISVDGRHFTEENQDHLRAGFVDSIHSAVELSGQAVLLFDHYEKALRRSHARDLQKELFSILVASESAQNVGCLFAHRGRARTSLNIASSPFVSRLSRVQLPRVSSLEGTDKVGTLWAYHNMGTISGADEFQLATFRASFSEVRTAIAADLTDDELLAITNLGKCAPVSDFVASITDPRSGMIGSELEGLRREVAVFTGNWPTDIQGSLTRFMQILVELGPSYWMDKYLFSPTSIRKTSLFISQLSHDCDVPLRVLVDYDDNWDVRTPGHAADFASECRSLSSNSLEIRQVDRRDASLLHDRHLMSRFDGRAYTLPQGAEIVCAKQTGLSNAGYTTLTNNYSQIWNRAREFSP